MPFDPARAIADLRAIAELTGGHGTGGARRVCWTDEWVKARAYVHDQLDGDRGGDRPRRGRQRLGLPARAGRRHGDRRLARRLGARGRLAGRRARHRRARSRCCARPPRRASRRAPSRSSTSPTRRAPASPAACSAPPPCPATWCRRSSPTCATATASAWRTCCARYGVEIDRVLEAGNRLDGARAYLELHIEQGPVLEAEGLAVGTVLGTVGVERFRAHFTGQAAHAGSTPIRQRRDSFLAAARTALELREIALRNDGVCTVGARDVHAGRRHGRPRPHRDPGRPAAPRRRHARDDEGRVLRRRRAARRRGGLHGGDRAGLADRADPVRPGPDRHRRAPRSARSPAPTGGCRPARCTTPPRSPARACRR